MIVEFKHELDEELTDDTSHMWHEKVQLQIETSTSTIKLLHQIVSLQFHEKS